jgi:bacteriocin biosynthesis cyclodehydratase domain-containing protein
MFKNFDVFYDEDNRCYQIRTKCVSFAIEFDNEEKQFIFETLTKELKKNNLGLKSLFKKLVKEFDEAKVIDVLSTLNEYDLLPEEEIHELEGKISAKVNPYYDKADASGQKNISDLAILLLGDSLFSNVFSKRFSKSTFKKLDNLSFSDFEKLKEDFIDNYFETFDLIVFDAVEWNPYFAELINRKALEHNKPWIFIGGFEEYAIKIGPIFYGKETGCYNCLVKRIKSNHDHVNYFNSYENYLLKNKFSSKPDQFIYLDTFYEMASSIVFLEITKLFELWSVPTIWKHFISINAINYEMVRHALLKVPFCNVCKPELEYNPAPWLETITLK